MSYDNVKPYEDRLIVYKYVLTLYNEGVKGGICGLINHYFVVNSIHRNLDLREFPEKAIKAIENIKILGSAGEQPKERRQGNHVAPLGTGYKSPGFCRALVRFAKSLSKKLK